MGLLSYMADKAYDPPADTSFWCESCDGNVVKSGQPETGKFFLMSGHVWNGINHPKPVGDDYPMVLFALCNDCLNQKER